MFPTINKKETGVIVLADNISLKKQVEKSIDGYSGHNECVHAYRIR